MDNQEERTYWDHKDFDAPYQMGPQSHRLYILDKFRQLGVKSLLDVGCGTGPIFELITQDSEGSFDNITKYKGTDYSWRMIQTAKRSFPHGNFEVQDARFLSENTNSWDCVLLMHCLDHLDDYQSAISEAVRVSNKYICVVLWRSFVDSGTNLNDRNMHGKQEGEEPWQDTHLQDYSKEVLAAEFDKHGLIDVDFNDGQEVNREGRHNIVWILKKP